MSNFFGEDGKNDTRMLAVADEVLDLIRRRLPGDDRDALSDRAMLCCYVLASVNGDADNDHRGFMKLVKMTVSTYLNMLKKENIDG
jgi:hypothetical protein